MGFITGLDAINKAMDRPKPPADYQKTTWLRLADGESVKARFVNELDSDSPNFDEHRGLAVVVAEHTSPDDFRKKAVCTQDTDGRCFACEMDRKEPRKGWRSRLRYYTNVLVLPEDDKPFVTVWSQGVSTKSAFNLIREYAMDTGSVSNLVWKIKRNGQGTETSYVLMPGAPDQEPFDWSPYEYFNLEKVVREVPYSEQEAFYLGFEANAASSSTIDW